MDDPIFNLIARVIFCKVSFLLLYKYRATAQITKTSRQNILDIKKMDVKLLIDVMFPELHLEPSQRSHTGIYEKAVNRL